MPGFRFKECLAFENPSRACTSCLPVVGWGDDLPRSLRQDAPGASHVRVSCDEVRTANELLEGAHHRSLGIDGRTEFGSDGFLRVTQRTIGDRGCSRRRALFVSRAILVCMHILSPMSFIVEGVHALLAFGHWVVTGAVTCALGCSQTPNVWGERWGASARLPPKVHTAFKARCERVALVCTIGKEAHQPMFSLVELTSNQDIICKCPWARHPRLIFQRP